MILIKEDCWNIKKSLAQKLISHNIIIFIFATFFTSKNLPPGLSLCCPADIDIYRFDTLLQPQIAIYINKPDGVGPIDMWHLTHDMWQMTQNMLWEVNIVSKFQVSSSNSLWFMLYWQLGGKGSIAELITTPVW